MAYIVKELVVTNETEIEILGNKAKRIMKKALVKAFGIEMGEYLLEYGAINTGNSYVIALNNKAAEELRQTLFTL